ncbi:cytochrome C oxidase subunit IV family protein [uncultured Kiloniella sp.]|uniref:cytochrome C oxidase subunit IV family protein n=1 Tax=uncultured Kiloniella sp. TaxID=1133091 RepID=UPI002611F566|nr:cytochrome C oxidase subunit IV family protein [uncultured Kiloniella sp.]
MSNPLNNTPCKKPVPLFRLIITWALMFGLTIISMFSGNVFESHEIAAPIGFIPVVILMLTTLFKCRLLLLDFLELRHVAPQWKRGFFFAILVITGMVLAAYALAFGI